MSISRVNDGLGSGSKASAEAIPALRGRVLFGILVVLITRARPYEYNPYAMLFRCSGLFELWLYSAQFRMQIRSGSNRHSVAAPGIGVGIAHHRKHIIKRQNSSRLCRGASFGGSAVASALLSATGFAA
jgi:hypothetical protein